MGWESVVVTDPRRAYAQGPPNGVVVERERKGEEHMTAVARVKREDFLRLNPDWYAEHITGIVTEKVSQVSVTELDVTEEMSQVTETKKCETCDRPHAGYGKNCPGCRKKAQRGT